jgi:hypothetical protein
MTKTLHHKSAVFVGHIELSPFKLQPNIIPHVIMFKMAVFL